MEDDKHTLPPSGTADAAESHEEPGATHAVEDGAKRRSQPKSAVVNLAEYEDPSVVKRYTAICESMKLKTADELGCDPSTLTAHTLSTMTGQLRALMEALLGRSADVKRRTMTKLPHKCFADYSPGGALQLVLTTTLAFKNDRGLRDLDAHSPGNKAASMELLETLQTKLGESGHMPVYRIFFSPSLSEAETKHLRDFANARATTVLTADEATHILHPDPEGTTPETTDGTDYCRTVKTAAEHALVHWWYHPDSYDSWVRIADVSGDPEAEEPHQGPWNVQLRWLADTRLFNEWMNELDYEMPEDSGTGGAEAKDRVETSASGGAKKSNKKRKRSEQFKGSSSPRRSPTGAGRDSEEVGALPHDRAKGRSADDFVMSAQSDSHRPTNRNRPGEESGKARKGHGSGSGARDNSREDSSDRARTKLEEKLDDDHGNGTDFDHSDERRPPASKRARHTESDAHSSHNSPGNKGLKVRINMKKALADDSTSRKHVAPKTGDNRPAPTPSLKVRVKMPVNPAKVDPGEDADMELSSRTKTEVQTLREEASPSRGEKSGTGNDVKAEDHEDRIARKNKRKRERRISQLKTAGVGVVEYADPIAEADIAQIRNISMDVRTSLSPDAEGTSTGDGDAAASRDEDGDATMLAATEKPQTRVAAVSADSLSTKRAGVPGSIVDLMESLPQTPVRAPAQSRWFRMDAIHDIERRSLPEFFTGRTGLKAPDTYKAMRDFIIDAWRCAPSEYLTATAARRHLAGDVCSILRVHAFLEHWGLINFGVDPPSRPQLLSMKGIRQEAWNAAPIVEQPSHSNAASRGTESSVPRLLLFDEIPPSKRNAPASTLKSLVEATQGKSKTEIAMASRREIYAAAAAVTYHCDGCGVDCSRIRYHCVGPADIDLCPSCFANGKYPVSLSARDFEQLSTVVSSEAYDRSVWSEAEVLLLLEGLERFGDNWNSVADHVGTKTNEQCVVQFLRMPIEDSFLGDQLGKWGASSGSGAGARNASGEQALAGGPLPFADASNPIMAQIAFLASAVSPEVAAAAAHAALVKLMSDSERPSVSGNEKQDRSKIAASLVSHESGEPKGSKATKVGQSETFPAKPVPVDGSTTAQPSSVGSNSAKAEPHGAIARPSTSSGGSSSAQAQRRPGTELDVTAVRASAAVGLAAAAARARKLADAEMREIEGAFALVVESKLAVIEEKLARFNSLETQVRRERERLEKQRLALYADRISVAYQRSSPHGVGLDFNAVSQTAGVPPTALPLATLPAPVGNGTTIPIGPLVPAPNIGVPPFSTAPLQGLASAPVTTGIPGPTTNSTVPHGAH